MRAASGRHRPVPGGAASDVVVACGPDSAAQESSSARARRAGKELARIESQLSKVEQRIVELHDAMAAAADDHVRAGELNVELQEVQRRKDALEEAWLAAAEE